MPSTGVGRGVCSRLLPTDLAGARWCYAEEQLDAAYQEVRDVKTAPRGLGFWGDMVVTLRNGDKIELRSLPQCAPSPAPNPEGDPKALCKKVF